jgi:hypothetical protein
MLYGTETFCDLNLNYEVSFGFKENTAVRAVQSSGQQV